jgi:uncharacterized membrane protein
MASKAGSKQQGNNKRSGRMDRRKNKEELEAARRKNAFMKGMLAIVILIAIIALVFVDVGGGPDKPSDYSTPYEIIGDEVVIPLADITTSAKFYSYSSSGTNVKFFALIGSDGDVHTAFDACDVCFDAKKGYYQDGNQMVCRNCGQRFTTNQIGTSNQGGGCWPGYLDRTVEGGYVKIKISDINSGRYYFA